MNKRLLCIAFIVLIGRLAAPTAAHVASASPQAASVTGADIVGLWAGSLREPGDTPDTMDTPPGPLYSDYQHGGTLAHTTLYDTVVFGKKGDFVVTREQRNGTYQQCGRYTVAGWVLTVTYQGYSPAFGAAGGSYRYLLSRSGAGLTLTEDEVAAPPAKAADVVFSYPIMLNRLNADISGPVFRGPSGPAWLGGGGELSQPYHYRSGGIDHYAESEGSWRLVRPAAGSQATPVIRLNGLRDGATFEAVTVPLRTLPGLADEYCRFERTPDWYRYGYTLELLQVADREPRAYVWAVHFQDQSPLEPDPPPAAPAALFPGLASPALRQWVSGLPPGVVLSYAPMMRMGFLRPLGAPPVTGPPDPNDPEAGLDDFGQFCRSKSVVFSLNEGRF